MQRVSYATERTDEVAYLCFQIHEARIARPLTPLRLW